MRAGIFGGALLPWTDKITGLIHLVELVEAVEPGDEQNWAAIYCTWQVLDAYKPTRDSMPTCLRCIAFALADGRRWAAGTE